ncbi:MAG: hypothetical protein LKF36_13910 [Lactobacillus sp.]|jgi:hypothetical protein|nr:hypothetical protein [Lactobacillus sp.]
MLKNIFLGILFILVTWLAITFIFSVVQFIWRSLPFSKHTRKPFLKQFAGNFAWLSYLFIYLP